MTADVARRVRRGAAAALWWPAGMAVAALYVAIMASPRRVPDLARFTRSAEFGQLQGAAAAWLDQAWELIDAATPWLDRVGGQVFDRCETSLQTRAFSIPRDPPSLTCQRGITVVYGLDGGWRPARRACCRPARGRLGHHQVHRARPRPQARHLGRQLVARHRGPAPGRARDDAAGTQETVAPAHARQLGQPRRLARADVPRPGPPTATATYRPVEITGTDPEQLAGQALARHEHAIAISVLVPYYLNANVNAHPCRLRRKALPAWESRPR